MQSNLKAGLLTLAVGLLMTGCKKATIDTNEQQQQENPPLDLVMDAQAIGAPSEITFFAFRK